MQVICLPLVDPVSLDSSLLLAGAKSVTDSSYWSVAAL